MNPQECQKLSNLRENSYVVLLRTCTFRTASRVEQTATSPWVALYICGGLCYSLLKPPVTLKHLVSPLPSSKFESVNLDPVHAQLAAISLRAGFGLSLGSEYHFTVLPPIIQALPALSSPLKFESTMELLRMQSRTWQQWTYHLEKNCGLGGTTGPMCPKHGESLILNISSLSFLKDPINVQCNSSHNVTKIKSHSMQSGPTFHWHSMLIPLTRGFTLYSA